MATAKKAFAAIGPGHGIWISTVDDSGIKGVEFIHGNAQKDSLDKWSVRDVYVVEAEEYESLIRQVVKANILIEIYGAIGTPDEYILVPKSEHKSLVSERDRLALRVRELEAAFPSKSMMKRLVAQTRTDVAELKGGSDG